MEGESEVKKGVERFQGSECFWKGNGRGGEELGLTLA